MLIQEEEEENKRPWRPRRAEQGGWEERAKDRSALRRFSPLLVKRGYKAQRDGLGESCTRCACSPPPSPPLSLLLFFDFFFFFLSSSCSSLASFLLLVLFLEEWLDCFRCANLTMQCGLAFLPSQVRRAQGGKRRNSRTLSSKLAEARHIGVDFTRSPRNISHPWGKRTGERLVEIDSASS